MAKLSINQRARAVLREVVSLHYRTCEPVGSGLISKTRVVPFSPATIRNILAHLEHSGFLCQPHTSAGRIPTDLGYRAFVDDVFLNHLPLAQTDEQRLDVAIQTANSGPALLECLADYIQQMTGLVTFYMPFRLSGIRLKSIHFERLNDEKLMMIWVSLGGHAYQCALKVNVHEVSQLLLEKTAAYLNRRFRGYSLARMCDDMQKTFNQNGAADLVVRTADQLTRMMQEDARRFDDINFRGFSSLVQMPEFQDINQIRVLIDILETHTKIYPHLQRAINQKELPITVFIGSELEDPEMDRLTIIVSKIKNRTDWLGCIGVIGPKRMPYQRMLQVLNYAESRVAFKSLPDVAV